MLKFKKRGMFLYVHLKKVCFAQNWFTHVRLFIVGNRLITIPLISKAVVLHSLQWLQTKPCRVIF